MKKLLSHVVLSSLFAIITLSLSAQIVINGHVYNITTQQAVVNHPVYINVDTTTQSGAIFSYYNIVYTDANGYYSDLVNLPASSMQILFNIGIYDCNNTFHQQTKVSTNAPLITDFSICVSNNTTPGTTACNAYFNYMPTSAANTIHFIDSTINTVGNILYYYWNFGDSTTSTQQNPIHTFPGNGIYNVCHIIATDSGCVSTFCQNVTIGGGNTSQCNTWFTYTQNNSNPLSLTFTAQSNNTNIVSYSWSFGTGNPAQTTQTPNIYYNFPSSGTWNVCLTILTSGGCAYTYCQSITIQSQQTNNQICGVVAAGSALLDNGLAILYSVGNSSGTYMPIDTTIIDSAGMYCFYNVPQGAYVILAAPSTTSIFYNNFLPTYYISSIFWSGAQLVYMPSMLALSYDVQLAGLIPVVVPGPGNIAGTVLSNLPKTLEINSVYEDLQVVLLNTDDEPLLYTYSDASGSFHFSGLPFGTYKVYPELPGKTTVPATVILDENNPDYYDVSIIINGTNVVASIYNSAYTLNSFISNLYPNPADEKTSFDISSDDIYKIIIEVKDITGKSVYTELFSNINVHDRITISTSTFPKGIYIVLIKDNSGNEIHRKLIKQAK